MKKIILSGLVALGLATGASASGYIYVDGIDCVKASDFVAGTGVKASDFVAGTGVKASDFVAGIGVKAIDFVAGTGVKAIDFVAGTGVKAKQLAKFNVEIKDKKLIN